MRQWHFIQRPVWPTFRDRTHAQYPNRVSLISALSGVACTLASASAFPQALQGIEGDPGQLAFKQCLSYVPQGEGGRQSAGA